jgi:hypothetical protein
LNNILHLCLGLPSGIFLSGFPVRTMYTSLRSPVCATWPAHLIILYLHKAFLSKIHVSFWFLYPTISEFDPRIKVCLFFINVFSQYAFRHLVKLPLSLKYFLIETRFHCVRSWYGSWDSSVIDNTRPQAGRPSSRCLTPGKGKDFLPNIHTGFGGTQPPVQ